MSLVASNRLASDFSKHAQDQAGSSPFLHRSDDDHTKPIFDLKGKTDQYALKFIKPAN